MKKNTFFILLFFSFSILMLSCSKMDDYKTFLKDIRYPGRVDSAAVFTGKNRVLLRMMLNNDPSVKKILIFWNNKTDSLAMDISLPDDGLVIERMIEPLDEGTYQFEFYTQDGKGNRSTPMVAQGSVLGDSYLGTLFNRSLEEISLNDDGSEVITRWSTPLEGESALEIMYEDGQGLIRRVLMPAELSTYALPDYKENGLLKYRSLFLPSASSVDTFSIAYSEVRMPAFERLLDKSRFKEVVLPTDTRDAYGWTMPFLWDGSVLEPGFHTPPGVGLPVWYTFDMGESVRVSRLKTWQRIDQNFLFNRGNPKKFEVWGTNAPPADGSWSNWEKIGTFESVKPSGLPLGSVNSEDTKSALAGESFLFAETDRRFRYIRFKILETYSGEDFTHLLEISLWTRDR